MRPIYGHEAMMHRLAGAVASSRFPQAALFVGAPGVGKQRLALWVAQGLLCQGGPGEPCGECGSCRQVLTLQHPDVHWFVPIERPKATAADAQKQVEQAADLLAEAIEGRRGEPLYPRSVGMASHPLASIRLLQRAVAMKPFQGPRKIVILGDAERLLVQESSQEASNALLKVLEEPPADTVVILTAAEPQALLPTIRSRLVPLRIGRVGDGAVREFLETELDQAPAGDALERRTLLAEGSVGRALWAEDEGDEGDRAAAKLMAAVARGPSSWAESALVQPPFSARGKFSTTLDALAVKLRDGLVGRSQAGETVDNWVEALRRVEETRAEARGNANPQLALAVLASDLERLL